MKNFFKLVSIIVFISSCGGGGGGGGGGGDAGGGGSFPAPTISITSDISSASTGDSALISWSSTNATSCTASGGWTGSKGTSGSESISLVAGNNTFSLSCSGSGGSFNQSVASKAPRLNRCSKPLSFLKNFKPSLAKTDRWSNRRL